MVATLILGVMLLGAWAYKISHFQEHLVRQDSPSSRSNDSPEWVVVGRITGMAACRWSDPSTQTYLGASVPLGRKLALAAGLLEITYNAGARVILEGPCTYRVESRAGGYLTLGKLTAKVEKREEGGGNREEGGLAASAASAKPQAADFFVKTPTAIVTDLGTEFGVAVSEKGDTTSHVFVGRVRVRIVGEGRQKEALLRAGESARIEKGAGRADTRLLLKDNVGALPKFARRIPEPAKYVDLLDVVAGGNGMGGRREQGIDPTTGVYEPTFVTEHRSGDHRYAPVSWSKLIDGVFIPDGGAGPVQVDSAGQTFAGFPKTSDETYGSLWSRAADVAPENSVPGHQNWVYVLGRDKRLMPEGRGLLCMHANQAITFDLEAVRRMHARLRPSRFRATVDLGDAHNVDPHAEGMADFWVLVDGRLKFKRMRLRPQDGAVKVDVEIGAGERFLTLAVTDGGNTNAADWAVFGDPVLEMITVGPKN